MRVSMGRRFKCPWFLLFLAALPTLYYMSRRILFKSSTDDSELARTNTRRQDPQLSQERPNLIDRLDSNPAQINPADGSATVLRAPPRRRNGRYVGSTGQHRFYQATARDWEIEPKLVSQMCRDTNLTQCNPPRRRTEQEKQADRAVHKPIRFVVYKKFSPDPSIPDFSECDYNNCVYAGTTVTRDTDAVYVYGMGLENSSPEPSVRLPHQVFIYSVFEPPYKNFGIDEMVLVKSSPGHPLVLDHTIPSLTVFSNSSDPNYKWRHYFNATQTYRLDADIPFPYGKLDFQLKEPKDQPDYRAIARKKTRTAVWLVSNCGGTPSRRMPYVKEMQKYIDIDIFGRCGEKCEVNDERCIPDLGTTYRFYLAFENSFCTDYTTEKFFKLFIDGMHIIPVVRGATDYTREFPEKTHVNAANFKGPKELALFLKALEENEDEYTKYLEVKDRYRGIPCGNRYCYICEYLQKLQALPESGRHRTIDLKKEFFDGHVLDPPVW